MYCLWGWWGRDAWVSVFIHLQLHSRACLPVDITKDLHLSGSPVPGYETGLYKNWKFSKSQQWCNYCRKNISKNIFSQIQRSEKSELNHMQRLASPFGLASRYQFLFMCLFVHCMGCDSFHWKNSFKCHFWQNDVLHYEAMVEQKKWRAFMKINPHQYFFIS